MQDKRGQSIPPDGIEESHTSRKNKYAARVGARTLYLKEKCHDSDSAADTVLDCDSMQRSVINKK
jgi:hypothetical protein